jgi:hypothetical protein
VTQARIKGLLILFITYVWFSLNHIQDPFGVLDENFRIYKLVTPIKSQQYKGLSPGRNLTSYFSKRESSAKFLPHPF